MKTICFKGDIMDRTSLVNLKGTIIEHKVFGPCEIVDITSPDEGKFLGKVIKTNESKKFIFSNQFFRNIEEFETVEVEVKRTISRKRPKRKVDLSKYRNHPLVKEIDGKEAKDTKEK